MISRTIEYALMAMSKLASLQGIATSCESIASATHVSQGYLSKIMRDLVRADLVKSYRGPHGGFELARDPGAISLLDIVNAVDPIQRTTTYPFDDPQKADLCPLHRCMDEVLEHVEARLRATSLESMLFGTQDSPTWRP